MSITTLVIENGTEPGGRNCSLYDDEDIIKVAIVNQALSILTVFACIFALTVVIILKKWQYFTQRLVLYLILSTMLISITRSLARVSYDGTFTDAHSGFCKFIAYTSQSTVWMPFSAVLSITVYLFLALVCNRRTDKYEGVYFFFIFAFPWTFSWIPFINSAYGRAGAWCWIRSVDIETCEVIDLGRRLQIALYYVPLIASLVFQIVLYLVMLCTLYRNKRRWKGTLTPTVDDTSYKIARKEALNLFIYPLVYLLSITIPIANRLRGWAAPGQTVLALWYLTAIAFPLRGIIFVLAFTLDADTRRRLTWNHLRATVRNYNSKKVVMEYKVEETNEFDSTTYTRFTDTSSVEKIELN